jgi:hypothetical protein
MAFFTVLQLHNNAFGLSFRAALPVQPGAKAGHNVYKVLDQVIFAVFGQIDHFDLTILHCQQLLDVIGPKTGPAIFLLNHNQGSAV